jgi:hypothetical protein
MLRLLKAVMAGAAATKAMDQLMLKPKEELPPVDMPAFLGYSVFKDMPGPRRRAGLITHYLLGALIFPVAYLATFDKATSITPPLKGALWGTALWLVGQTLVVPSLGRAGYFLRKPTAILTYLFSHWIYGTVFGALLQRPQTRS